MATVRRDTIKVCEIKFDELNPRIPNSLQGITDEKKIIEYMIKFGNVTDLMYSIVETGYSDAEPLLVVYDESDSKYVAVEGNRRLAALKLLNDPKIATLKIALIQRIVSEADSSIPQEVPCVIYETREQILDYLGYRHITGVKDWGALEKAKYLDILYHNHIESCSPQEIYTKLAKMIGSRSDYVQKLHLAYKLYNKANDDAYYDLNIRENDMVGKFSWITNSLGRTGVQRYLGLADGNCEIDSLNAEHFRNYFKWMFDREDAVVEESRHISDLASVLESEDAIKILEKTGSLDEAVLYTDEPEKQFVNFLKSARTSLSKAKYAIEKLGEKPYEVDELLDDIVKLKNTITGALNENFPADQGAVIEKLSSLDRATLESVINEIARNVETEKK